MTNKQLEKQLNYYNGKCWEYHNKMKYASIIQLSNLQKQYDKNNKKYNEIRSKIESDGKHKVVFVNNGNLTIKAI